MSALTTRALSREDGSTGRSRATHSLTRMCRSWKKMRSVCRISWNSPAERPPYICAGKAETGIPLSEVRWETVDRQGWGGWVPRHGARRQEDSAAGRGGGAGGEYHPSPSPPRPRPPVHPRGTPHCSTPREAHSASPVPQDSAEPLLPAPFQKS